VRTTSPGKLLAAAKERGAVKGGEVLLCGVRLRCD
jgi:hypothetical protein